MNGRESSGSLNQVRFHMGRTDYQTILPPLDCDSRARACRGERRKKIEAASLRWLA